MKYNSKKPSILKQIIVITGLFVFLFGGMFATIIGFDNFKNYDSPYLFVFAFGTLGLVIGIMVAKKIKPYVILNPKMLNNYSNLTIMFSVGFIGGFILLGHHFNSTISTLYKCDTFSVIDKEFHKGGFRQPELNILILNVEGENKRLLCRQNYWQTVSIGQTVNACIYKSPIGLDYTNLPDNK
ncbi:hypothetical protein [Limnovirga soli]|uniref:Uncharacterized protein n=1 Tax=Limnovirga soli TaxID=2656915 RepID=A0A8J8FAZ5_9BACT|nr:hypothetical protein [Limnovirga soli]NNV54735.1 hypothetical protein [Limnovirga soli]